MKSFGSTFTLAMLLVVATAPFAHTEEPEDARGFKAAKGRVTFRTYCASCHGTDAKGEGSIARYLKVAPSDLTAIAERRGGEFPHQEITEIIDGRREAKGHGTREMPVWGDVFQSPLSNVEPSPEEEPEERVERKLEELVLYLESIQASSE